MNVPCDECEIRDICGLVATRKHAANKVDQILRGIEDGFIQIPIICTRKQEKDQTVTVGEDAGGNVQELLQIHGDRDGCVQNDGGHLSGVPFGIDGTEGEGSAERGDEEVEPVRRGQWIKHDDDDTIHCSVCGWEGHRYEDDVYGMPRCPKCGAWMEPVEDEN